MAFPDGPIVIGGFSGNSTTNGVVGATIAGGGIPDFPNKAWGDFSTVSGGAGNTASDPTSTVGGGARNTASGDGSTVSGGESNIASGAWSTVAGGHENTAAGNHSFAAGYRAKANHAGTFVWADNTDADFASTAADQFLIQASGGVGIGTTNPTEQLHVSGNLRVSDGTLSCGGKAAAIRTWSCEAMKS